MRRALALLVCLGAAPLAAYEGHVAKETFSMGPYTTVGGERIEAVRVGYETYGTLSEERDNAILVTQPFSASSHAAGRYRESDPAPGYWDAIIGSGAPIDTDRFFVVSVDTLANLRPDAADVVTTGPASVDPATGEPYGLDFPLVTIRDFVEVQRALLDSLGIDRLHAVIGASMGAMQAVEWASAYPERVDRLVAVAGTGGTDAWITGWGHVWRRLVRLDPRWRGGDYYGRAEPVEGLTAAFELVLLQTHHPQWAARRFGRRWAAEGHDPAASLGARFAIEAWLAEAARRRAREADANSFLYLVKALQLFGHGGSLEERLGRIEAEVLLVPMASDLLFFPSYSRRAATILREANVKVRYREVEGEAGHADDVLSIESAGETLRDFLDG